MSTVITKNLQIGADGTATNNFTLYQPATPDGTLRLGNGNTGITSSLLTLTSGGNLSVGAASNPVSKFGVTASSASVVDLYRTGAAGEARLNFYNDNASSTATVAGRVGALLTTTTAGAENGALLFGTTAAGTTAEKMRLDSAGNLGLGVTPSAWQSTWKALELTGGAVSSLSDRLLISQNAFINSSGNYAYVATDVASAYRQTNGRHEFYTAPSGTAGNTITFTQAMTLDASGMLGLGVTPSNWSSSYKTIQLGSGGSVTGVSTIPDAVFIAANTYSPTSTYNNGTYIATAAASYYRQLDGDHSWFTAPSGTAGNAITFTERMRLDVGGNLGVGTISPAEKLTVSDTVANDGVYISVLNNSGTGSKSGIKFDRATGQTDWRIENDVGNLTFATATDSATYTERARFASTGGFTCAGVYSTTVGATNRDVFVDNTGVVGYVSSTRASKTNIADLTDTSWLHQLNPVTFNYRKKAEDGSYTDEIDGDIQYGMIAEDVEQVRPDLCFYDETEAGKELRGIQYSKLVPVMLKALQEQQAIISAQAAALEQLKADVAALKGAA